MEVKAAAFYYPLQKKTTESNGFFMYLSAILLYVPFRFLLIFTMYLWTGEGAGEGGGNLYCTGTVRILTVPVSAVKILTVPLQNGFHSMDSTF
jgi:hypothetical protein